MDLLTVLAIALGGALGTISRYLIALATAPISGTLPWGTVIINVAGSFLIGLFGTLTLANGRYPAPEIARLFVMVGFCGGFTTFSSFSLQTLDLLRAGAIGRAAINAAASVTLCLASVALGHVAGAALNGGAVPVVQASIEEEA